ncbi:hypothetical protein PRZ48_009814 [Zasmidium cellare]|uniref:Methyltransferase domain-containing protein n=1 Tax=Zasmidium cellare TaxID=395010 RepID=A0ABR0EDF3_ZASCE|nr:hypothetical protein PRZ48_009814 [Zasmidium cellare]
MADNRVPESVATARAQAEKQGLTNVQFFVGDAENIDYPDDTFDIAHAHQVMLHLPRPVHRGERFDEGKYGQVLQASKAKGARGGDSGTVNHIWMHEAGFGRENIHSGSVGFDNDKEEMPTLVHGAIGFATSRNESDDYIQKLREDGDAWVADPSSRAIALDSWVVGVK